MSEIIIVSATRHSETKFYETSALGKSLNQTFNNINIRKKIFFENTLGLPILYNRAIKDMGDPEDILVFIHDDVFLIDFFWLQKIRHGLIDFDLIGIAGNIIRSPYQPAWLFVKTDDPPGFTWDIKENLSGVVGHGEGFPCYLSEFGPTHQKCKLLDGVILASKRKSFIEQNIFFDERFTFHFYDMDICRQFELNNLTMGTIALNIIHISGGAFGIPAWRIAYAEYLDKWKV